MGSGSGCSNNSGWDFLIQPPQIKAHVESDLTDGEPFVKCTGKMGASEHGSV